MRDCMSKAGYPYSSPNDIEPPHRESEDVGPSETERNLAVTDVTCKMKSSLMETWWEEEAAAENRLLAQHAGEVKRQEALRAHELSVARDSRICPVRNAPNPAQPR